MSEMWGAARQMMASALEDADFDWVEAERIADSLAFKVLDEFRALKEEVRR